MRDELLLSKSKYMAGLQCPKLLWMHYHAKDQFPPIDAETQAKFDQGHLVNGVAHKLFPDGIEIEGYKDLEGIAQETQFKLGLGKPLFEPGFRYQSVYARPDILRPNGDGAWDLLEVKSTTSVEETHLQDVACQRYCYEGSGLKINKTFLVHINNEYVREGDIDPEALFTQEDITDAVRPLVKGVEENVARMLGIIKQQECPKIKIGPQCDDPHGCPLKDLCWSFLPEQSVFKLNRMRKAKAFELLARGILDLCEVPEDQPLTASQKIQWVSHTQQTTHINMPAVQEFLGKISLPVYFLDFETVGPAIPYYDQSRPYQQVPFQFSLHILSDWGSKTEHHAFLAEGREDPRPALLSKLKALLGDKGTILAYNMSFELGKLKDSVEVYPDYKKWFAQIEPRFMDLIDPFRKFDYYDPKQGGRTSIKNVFPALTGHSYEGLGIADGGAASREYARVTFTEGILEAERERVRKDLETYCALDTQAMIEVLAVLRRAATAK